MYSDITHNIVMGYVKFHEFIGPYHFVARITVYSFPSRKSLSNSALESSFVITLDFPRWILWEVKSSMAFDSRRMAKSLSISRITRSECIGGVRAFVHSNVKHREFGSCVPNTKQ